MWLTSLWHRLFLEERPSIGLSFFRISVALTTGLHVIPSFFHLADNYFHTAFKTYNFHFFPVKVIELVQQSSDGVVVFFVGFFLISWFSFLIGLWTQLSCFLMMVGCYYFYALNCFHIGTLSWDILLVTLFLMCVTPYPGDYFSIDCLFKKNPLAFKTPRPFFLQRLLQLQIASTFFYTAFYKITPPHGNWLTENPIYFLMNNPPAGVVKNFLLKEFWAAHSGLCYATGLMIVTIELLFPVLLFWHKTRRSAIFLGWFFHLVLILTLDVPAIFFFLFPAQLLLFVNPQKIVDRIEAQRNINLKSAQSILLFDGQCGFCRQSVSLLQVMDLFNKIKMVDFNQISDLTTMHSTLDNEKAKSQMHLIEPDGDILGGFFAVRRLSLKLPMMFVLIPALFFPGVSFLGPIIYQWVAKNRYLFHSHQTCQDNACFR